MNDPIQSQAAGAIVQRRDEGGRLVELAIDHGLPDPAPDTEAWLIAVDGSAPGLRAAEEGLRLAGRMNGCLLHVVNVQRWLSKEAAETELMQRALADTAAAAALFQRDRRPWRLHAVMGEPAERIVELAGRLGCRGIVMGSRGLGAAENLLVGSVAYKVIHSSPAPVLVVR